ncbi:MAG: DUF2169 domain-containing protein [Granulosicoccus sp.]
MRIVVDRNASLSTGYIPNLTAKNNIRATFIVKVVYKLTETSISEKYDEEPELLSGDIEYADEDGIGTYYDSDFAPYKPNADVMLVGTARAPTELSATSFPVSMTVGDMRKQLIVYGKRHWNHAMDDRYRATEPEVARSVSIHYGNSFGGSDSQFNSLGSGYFESDNQLPSDQKILPFIEYPDNPVRAPGDMIAPAGFGPIAYSWPSRTCKLGTYDDQWLANQWPWFPKDIDWSFFNAAPLDQQIKGYLHGDESIHLVNLVKDNAEFKTSLPGQQVKLFLNEITQEGGQSFRQIKMHLDTLWIDVDKMKLVLTWRGVGKVATPKLKEVEHIYVVSEPLSAPARPLREYSKQLFSILAEIETEGDAEMDAAVAALDVDESFDVEAHRAEFAQMDKEFDALVEESERPLTHADFPGLDNDIPLTPENEFPASFDDSSVVSELDPETLKVQSEAEAEVAQVNAEADREIALMDAEFSAMDTDNDSAMDRESVEVFVARREDLSGLEFTGLDLANIDFSGQVMNGTTFHDCKLDGCMFSDVELQAAEFNGSSLVGVTFRNSKLDDASFAKTILTDTVFDGVSMSDAEFKELTFNNTRFKGCNGSYIDFADSVLVDATVQSCRFTSCSFDNCNLSGLDLGGCDLTESSFTGVTAVRTNFSKSQLHGFKADEDADFTEANFQESIGTESQWGGCKLTRVRLDGACFDGARFEDCLMDGVSFIGASAKNVCFEGANLWSASLRDSNFLRASFERAELTDASLHGSNLYESTFLFAEIPNTDFTKTNLAKAMIRNHRE